MQKFRSVWLPSRKELKMAGEYDKKAIWALLLSILAWITTFKQNYQNYQLVVTPNEMVGLYWRALAIERPATIFVWFVPSTRIFLMKAIYMVLWSVSSARIFLPLSQEDPSARDKYNPLLHIDWIQETYGARMIHPLGSSWSRLCFKKNWRKPSALSLWNPRRPAYDLYEKSKIF